MHQSLLQRLAHGRLGVYMRIVQINAAYKIGSTGKIMSDLNDVIVANGHEGYMVCAYSAVKDIPNLYVTEHVNYELAVRKNIFISRVTGTMGYRQKSVTKKMIEWIEKKKPDVVHLHNIHGDWLNIHVLFKYLKASNVKVVWTLHDCWSFTGRCSHFELYGCEKWKNGCFKCVNNRVYPISYFFDFSKRMYADKKELFAGLSDAVLVTPSKWLAEYVNMSYLNEYPVKVINNGIDLSIFYPRTTFSPYLIDCKDKKVILGVASSWTENKGLLDIYKLNELIDHTKYQIVLIGLNVRQLADVPKNIMAIGRTNNADELAEIYSNADVFVNPTYQDNFPTTNLESLACGTPVITYKTGGSIESIDEDVGIVIKQGDVEGLKNALHAAFELDQKKCVDMAVRRFDKRNCFARYLQLYNESL